MREKTNALKAASRVISVITKIGYSAMAVAIGICAVLLIFIAATGGQTSTFTVGETNFVIFDEISATPVQTAGICGIMVVMGGIFLAIFLLAYKMFHEISLTGNPFIKKYVKTVRAIGILTAVMPIAGGITESIVTIFCKIEVPDIYTELPCVLIGAIIFCLSYIIDYGCMLKWDLDLESESDTK